MKKLNKKQTIQNILDRANQTNGISIDVAGFNKKAKNDDDFVKGAAKFVGAEVVYDE